MPHSKSFRTFQTFDKPGSVKVPDWLGWQHITDILGLSKHGGAAISERVELCNIAGPARLGR